MQEVIHAMCEHRNKVLHESEEKEANNKEKEKLNSDIGVEYDKGVENLQPDERGLFNITEDEAKNSLYHQKKVAWNDDDLPRARKTEMQR